ncbi:MAG: prepilin-type N-terminal cleavage/methylation domain-containing protein [Chloroflexi bacterium]|nr:prepilin-type N-terminal cleavage/methylation domain-containing protein [Chloroflexota bacterium]
MKKLQREEGFTLVEILIVLIILALLVAIVIPAVSGFLGRGRSEAFNGDGRNIQAVVDSYYTDKSLRVNNNNAFPTTAAGGLILGSQYAIISAPYLVNSNYMRSIPASAGTDNGGGQGHYTWIISGANGKVAGCPSNDGSVGTGISLGLWGFNAGKSEATCIFDGQYP